ncbi:MAG: tRNA (N(6)-L-threonylcarbamoyladenosine(37)-C(2))-methylthiotransferase MtaB [Patescibacteria group bacterium]|nr:tRNA (N(6)-L-threonylcarbamoyladenosine(37)-C(2))-methylthiotransferase MtaB [Patescibacteria group bacterium]
MIKTFKIYTLGCKVNQYDSERLKIYLKEFGLSPINVGADLAIINTCSVTKATGHKNSRMLALAKKDNPKAKLILVGCWARIYGNDLRNFGVDLVLTDKNPEILAQAIAEYFSLKKISLIKHTELVASNRSRYTIKVQDGCEQFCSYCIIPYSRGKLWSRPLNEVLGETQKAVDKKYPEIILTGIHLGLYKDEETNTNLSGLLKKMLALGGNIPYRLSSIEITEVSDELIDLYYKNLLLAKHLHISLQSGSDKILRLMNRPYRIAYFEDRINKIRKLMPDFAITTDIIVGFPGETDQDFEDTCAFVKKIKFSKIHVFPFSAHEITPAFSLPGQNSSDVIKKRARLLRELSVSLEKDFYQKFLNKNLPGIITGKRAGKYFAKTEYFFDVEVKDEKNHCLGEKIIVSL